MEAKAAYNITGRIFVLGQDRYTAPISWIVVRLKVFWCGTFGR
jgi:hypothetical protein